MNILKEFFKPLICNGDEPIIIDKDNIIPRTIAFELRFMLDMLFFGAIYVYILYLFYGSLVQGLFSVYATYVCVFWGSTMIGNHFLIPFLKKHRKV